MSDENSTLQSAGEALPETPAAKPAPRNDAEAEAQAAESPAEPNEDEAAKAAKAESERAERKKNRTSEYINRIQTEAAELRRKVAELEAKTAPKAAESSGPAEGEPTLESCDFDQSRFLREHSKWAVEQTLKAREESTKQAESASKQQQTLETYTQKVAEFADDHPDFHEVVGSIQYPLSEQMQAAILAHENGPQIAYHLGSNDDDAFALASIQPHLAAAAVERLASRLTATQAAPAPNPIPAAPKPKPVSQAPAPIPTVSGRSPTDTPPEKLTDEAWLERERNRRRKA